MSVPSSSDGQGSQGPANGGQVRRIISDIEDVRLDGRTFHVLTTKADCHVNESPFGCSAQNVADRATLYYTRFVFRPGAGNDGVVAIAADGGPLLDLSDEKLSIEDMFLSGEVPKVVCRESGALMVSATSAPSWRPVIARGPSLTSTVEMRPRNRNGTCFYADRCASLDADKAEYTLGVDPLAPADHDLLRGRLTDNCPRLTDAGDLVYQPGGGCAELGYNTFQVANQEGTHQTLKSPVAGTLLAADRVGGALVLVLTERPGGAVCVWNSATGQVWRHPVTKGRFEAWDPRTGDILMSDTPLFLPLKAKSELVLWHYLAGREEQGWIEWPEMLRSP